MTAVSVLVLLSSCALLDDNLQEVRAQEFYRSGQMSGSSLGDTIEKLGVRTVVNLRGHEPEKEWYREEVAVCRERNVAHHDLDWSSRRLPEPESLARFVRIIRVAREPILVHCGGGTHRSGVAAASFLLLEGAPVEEARGQLGIFFGNAPIGEVLDLYEGSELPFDRWVFEVYPALFRERAESQKPAG
ncbi:MAG: tyrosine-protein phosphatase [Planctomycetota bacterium]